MSLKASKLKVAKPTPKGTAGRLFFLSASSGQIFTSNPDGSDLKVIVSEGRRIPDGIVVDIEAGHLYWTNMGNPNANDGSIERADIDGRNASHIVSNGGTFTPKQLQLDRKNRKLYWSDREGMRIMRANLDGSKIETLVDTSLGDARPGKDAGPRKGPKRQARAASSARIWRSQRARRRETGKTLKFSTTTCPNPSISISIWPTE